MLSILYGSFFMISRRMEHFLLQDNVNLMLFLQMQVGFMMNRLLLVCYTFGTIYTLLFGPNS